MPGLALHAEFLNRWWVGTWIWAFLVGIVGVALVAIGRMVQHEATGAAGSMALVFAIANRPFQKPVADRPARRRLVISGNRISRKRA